MTHKHTFHSPFHHVPRRLQFAQLPRASILCPFPYHLSFCIPLDLFLYRTPVPEIPFAPDIVWLESFSEQTNKQNNNIYELTKQLCEQNKYCVLCLIWESVREQCTIGRHRNFKAAASNNQTLTTLSTPHRTHHRCLNMLRTMMKQYPILATPHSRSLPLAHIWILPHRGVETTASEKLTLTLTFNNDSDWHPEGGQDEEGKGGRD